MEQKIPKWLEDLQESSWELELLISGGAIFSLFQVSDYLTETIQSLKITNQLPGTNLFLIFGSFSIQVLTLGFILHLLLRAFWLALVCINYVFPQGAKREKVKWRRPFKPRVNEGDDLYQAILKTDNLCGVVMFMSIISTFLLAGIIVLVIVFLTVPGGLFHLNELEAFQLYFSFFSWLLLFYILDLLLFGFLRKIPGLSFVFFPFFRLFDLVSLRFLFQNSLWLFNTNIKKTQLALFAGLFLVAAFFYSYSTIYRVMNWHNVFDQRQYRFQMASGAGLASGYYMDEMEGRKITHMAIPSKVIENQHLELFMVYRKEYDWLMAEQPDSVYLSDIVRVAIDDSVYLKLNWFPTWKKDNDQLGITTMIPLMHLPNGEHVLTVQSTADTTYQQDIVFWKEGD